jgi:hypothetical protein
MADEGYGRTFPGDPNPPAKAPQAAPAPAAPPEEEMAQGPKPSPEGEARQSRPAKAVFRVSADEDGRQSVYMMDEQLETTRLGSVNIGNANELLDAVGQLNPKTGAWSVPEAAARQLLAGDMPIPDYVPAKYRANKALIARGALYTDWMRGKLDLEEAHGRGDLELLKMQIKEAPLFVWQGDTPKTIAKMWSDLKEAGPVNAAARVAGEAAGVAAFMTDSPAAVATGMLIAAPLIASKGAAAPLLIPVAAKALELGASALVFKRSYEIEGGNAAAEMLEKGFDEKTVRELAPLVGVVNGALETVGFHMIPAPYRRVLARKVLAAPAVTKVLANAYLKYLGELGIEITTEVAQERMNVYAETLAAETENRPDLAPKEGESFNRYGQVALASLLGTGPTKVPGMVLEAAVDRAGQAKMTAKIEKRKAAAAATPLVTKTPAEVAAAAPAAELAPNKPELAPAGDVTDYVQTHEKVAAGLEKLSADADAGKISPDEFVAGADKALEEISDKAMAEMDATPSTYGEKVQEAERKGRIAQLKQNLADITRLIDETVQFRERMVRNEQSTALIDSKLDNYMQEEADIRGGIEYYDKQVASRVGLEENETVAMKPATLENIINVGFKEGRKEVIQVRAKAIKELAAANKLTQADVRLLLRDKNIGLMGDVEFRNFMEGHERMNEGKLEKVPGFREKVKAHVERKDARNEVRKTLKERGVKREANIRALKGLPAINKMSTEQLGEYVEILKDYEIGAVALTPKRVKSLEGGKLAGARTFQDVLVFATERVKVDLASFLSAQKGQFDGIRDDTQLSESQPLYGFMVAQVQAEEAIGALAHQEFERANMRLGTAALNSRAKLTTLAGLGRRLVPQMPEVMVHLEHLVSDPDVYAGVTNLPELTPEEQAYVDFLRDFYTHARAYLETRDDMETRFEGRYVPHMRRTVAEIVAGISDTGVKAAVGDFYEGLFSAQKELLAPESVSSPGLGLSKFFKFSQFRSGKMTPSNNLIRVSNTYAKQFFKKQALDRAVPVVDSVVEAMRGLGKDKSPETEMAWDALGAFVKKYLNNKKGIQGEFNELAPRGGIVDLAVRFVSGWVSLAYIAGNITLQLAAPVGETAAASTLIAGQRKGSGLLGLALANWRMLNERTKANRIFEKYEAVVGKGAFAEVLEAGKSIDQRAGASLYALLQWSRTRTMKTLLMAMMTDKEFEAETISPERLAEIKVITGRWIDIAGMKSVVGSTTLGAAFTKFRGWQLPILRTSIQNVTSLLHSLGAQVEKTGVKGSKTAGFLVKLPSKVLGNDKPLSAQQAGELYGIVEFTFVAAAISMAMGDAEEDDDLRKRVRSELFSLTQVFDPRKALTVGVVASFTEQIGRLLWVLLTLEEYAEGSSREGEKKAPTQAAKMAPFGAAARNFKSAEEEN